DQLSTRNPHRASTGAEVQWPGRRERAAGDGQRALPIEVGDEHVLGENGAVGDRHLATSLGADGYEGIRYQQTPAGYPHRTGGTGGRSDCERTRERVGAAGDGEGAACA